MFDALIDFCDALFYYGMQPFIYCVELPARVIGRLLAKPLAKMLPTETYSVSDDGITRENSKGEDKLILWSDVQRVSIVTTDAGPFCDDFFYVFESEREALFVPLDWFVKLDIGSLLIPRFAGLDCGAMVKAAGSCVNAHYTLWSRDS